MRWSQELPHNIEAGAQFVTSGAVATADLDHYAILLVPADGGWLIDGLARVPPRGRGDPTMIVRG